MVYTCEVCGSGSSQPRWSEVLILCESFLAKDLWARALWERKTAHQLLIISKSSLLHKPLQTHRKKKKLGYRLTLVIFSKLLSSPSEGYEHFTQHCASVVTGERMRSVCSADTIRFLRAEKPMRHSKQLNASNIVFAILSLKQIKTIVRKGQYWINSTMKREHDNSCTFRH